MASREKLEGVKSAFECVVLVLPLLNLKTEDDFPKFSGWVFYLIYEGFVKEIGMNRFKFTEDGKSQVVLRHRYIQEAKDKI